MQKILITNSLYLGLVNIVTGYYEELLENVQKYSDNYFEILHDLIYHHLTFANNSRARELSEQACEKLSSSNSQLIYNKHLRLKAWFATGESKYEEAIAILEKIIDYCIINSEYQLLIESYNYLGVVYWHMGHYEKARIYLKKSLSTAQKHRLQKYSFSTLSNLAF